MLLTIPGAGACTQKRVADKELKKLISFTTKAIFPKKQDLISELVKEEDGIMAAERRGIAEGARQAAIANARNALNMGLSPEQASQIIALSLEQVLKLREMMKTES